MNNILQLKGQFQKRKAPSGFGPVNLPKGKSVSVEHVLKLKKQLQDIVLFWSKEKIIKGALVSVHYRKVVAKSNRIQILLSENGNSEQVISMPVTYSISSVIYDFAAGIPERVSWSVIAILCIRSSFA